MHGAAARRFASASASRTAATGCLRAFIWDLAHRRELISNRGLMQVIDRLYWDEAGSRPKRGVTTENRPGTLRRLIRVVDQLGLNYDLYGMTGEQIVELLPPEFDDWIG